MHSVKRTRTFRGSQRDCMIILLGGGGKLREDNSVNSKISVNKKK